MPPIAIEAEGVSFRYGSQVVLRDASLRIPEGDFVAVIGPNGGGKSTLLKVLLGLLQPETGVVRLLGGTPVEARRRIGYVPQDTGTNRDFPITAEDVVMMGLHHSGRGRRSSRAADREKAREALRRCGITDKRDRLIGQLSGGERQRVYIARAIVNDPKILFLDEPTSSIDPAWQKSIHDLFTDLNTSMTIALVSHDISVISRNVKSVLCVNRSAHYHPSPEITPAMLETTYHCPVELIAHGVPHRVFAPHEGAVELPEHDCAGHGHEHGGDRDA